jgi:hypothetical protein
LVLQQILTTRKLSIETQFGYYVYKPFKYDIDIYQRLVLKYYINKNIFTGTGKFYGENFICQNIKIFQRGSNDMILKPIQSISGKILNTGNVILKNNPPIIDVQQLFSGHLILN